MPSTDSTLIPRRIKDITNHKFGRYLVLEFVGTKGSPKYEALWRCRCKCGRIITLIGQYIRRERFPECPCTPRAAFTRMRRSSGAWGLRSHRIWKNMHRRCYDPRRDAYPNYGGRGIRVCDEWFDFHNFFDAMGEPPSRKHSLDRIDNDKNYYPENCRWVTRKQQNRNKRSNRLITYDSQTRTASEWSEITRINQFQIIRRLNRGWPIEEALDFKEHLSRQGQRPARTGYKSECRTTPRS